MTALVQALSSPFTTTTITGSGTLKALAIFCGAGLFVSLLFAAYGLDLSPGFF